MTPAASQDRSQARSLVMSDRGIAATSHPLASQAAAQVLARGGSAIDAAIAANITLGVVEPASCGIGGDLFMIHREAKSGRLTGLNASGWSGQALPVADLKRLGGGGMPQLGIHSVTVPGCVEGWNLLHRRFGRRPWAELFAPGIHFAEHGFAVTEMIGQAWAAEVPKLASDVNARQVYLHAGAAPAIGERFRNPAMGAALRLIAEGGPEAFYRGPIAEAIVRTSRRLGGHLTLADLSEFAAEWVEPITTTYHGWKVCELRPNGQGIAALEMLNLFAQFPLAGLPPRGVEELHLQIEAQKLAYADLQQYVADPRAGAIPVAELLSLDYARRRAKLIDPRRAANEAAPGNPLEGHGDTVNLAVVDREGNIASLIQSVYKNFGSGVVVDDYGFALQNRGAMFVLDPTHANAAAPRKRPFHTIIPAFMAKGDVSIGFGIMGGLNQAQAHAQFVSNVVDHGMNLQAALEAPRFTKATFGGCDVAVENRIDPAVRDALAARGHDLALHGDFSSVMGGAQVVMHNAATGLNTGASDPRKDGAAIPEPHPYF